MNCKTKRKSWRRLAAALLAALCLLTGSGAALAAQAAGETTTPESAASPERSASTPETAASDARFSFTVLDADYEAPASGNLDESLFAIKADEARMPTGEVVPVLLQVADPAPGSSVTVILSEGAVFTDTEMAADTGATYTRTFTNGEQASAWMLYVRADGGFTAKATYAGLDGETLTRTISVARYPQLAPFSAFSARAGEHQYHITDVTKVGGEWLITFEGEDQSYCLDEGMNGKPSASVYWTYYGTTDLLDKAVAAGCSSKLDIQRYKEIVYPDLHSYIQAEIVPEMQQKLRQGFGRAIRTETDSCAVAILDPRAAPGGRYHRAVLDALPAGIPITTNIEEIQTFLRARKSPDFFLSEFENDSK